MFVLLIEGDHEGSEVSAGITDVLRLEGHTTHVARASLLTLVGTLCAADLLIVDASQPTTSVPQTVLGLRSMSSVHIMIVNGDPDPDACVAALAAGADIFVARPFRRSEFVARLRAVERKIASEKELVIGDLRIDVKQERATVRDIDAQLLPDEIRLLVVLARDAGRFVPYTRLLEIVDYKPVTLMRYVARLRMALEGSDIVIETVEGRGVRVTRRNSD